jgi:hypothetical protein
VPICAFVLLAMVCPAAIDLAVVVGHSGCFAVIAFSMTDALAVIGLSGGCFAAIVVGLPRADALLPIVLWSLPMRMLCRIGNLCFFHGGCLVGGTPGGCFAASGSLVPSLAHLLLRACWPSSWRILGRRGLHWQMLCHRCCWILAFLRWLDALPLSSL